jgi:hypothetical protein
MLGEPEADMERLFVKGQEVVSSVVVTRLGRGM